MRDMIDGKKQFNKMLENRKMMNNGITLSNAFKETEVGEKYLPHSIDSEIDAIGAANALRNQGFNSAVTEVKEKQNNYLNNL